MKSHSLTTHVDCVGLVFIHVKIRFRWIGSSTIIAVCLHTLELKSTQPYTNKQIMYEN